MLWMGATVMSSLTMVPWPCPSETVAPVTVVTLTKKSSLSSPVESALTLTVNW
jgi:hypothetical protein